jgi:hypothetical protein
MKAVRLYIGKKEHIAKKQGGANHGTEKQTDLPHLSGEKGHRR